MKKLLFIALTLISTLAFGQNDITRTNPVGNNPANTSTFNKSSVRDANLTAVLNLRIPVYTSFSLRNAKDSIGYVMYNTSIGRMGIYKGGGVWDTISTSGTSSLLNYYTKTQSNARFAPLTRSLTINGTTQTLASDRTWSVGTVTSLGLTPGTGISVSGSPVISSGSITVTNTLPDQTVVLNNGTGISNTGTYPNFTVTNTLPDQTVVLNAGTGISTSGTYPNFTITNTAPSSGGTVISITPGYGLTPQTPITSSGSFGVDTTDIQSVINFFPKGDIRYALKSRTISSGTGLLGGGDLSANRTISADTTFLRTGANSESLAGLQTRFSLKENISNKAIDFTTVNNTLYPTVLAVKTYADGLVVGLLNDRGSYDASTNLYPSTGGSGTGGAIKKGNLWAISVPGTLGGVAVGVGDWIRALIDSPGQTASNWGIVEGNFGYVPENVANKATDLTSPNDTKYPTTLAVSTGLSTKQPVLSGSGLVKSTGGTISYITDNSTNWNTAYGWGNPSGVYLPLTGGTLTGDLSLTNAEIQLNTGYAVYYNGGTRSVYTYYNSAANQLVISNNVAGGTIGIGSNILINTSTGALTGTSATLNSTGTHLTYQRSGTTQWQQYVGSGNDFVNYASGNTYFYVYTNGVERLALNSTALALTVPLTGTSATFSGKGSFGGSAIGTFNAYSNLTLGSTSTANSGLVIASSTTGNGLIEFADGVTGNQAYRGFIQYDHTNDKMYFGTGGATRYTIDASGNNTWTGSGTFGGTLNLPANNNINIGGGRLASWNTSAYLYIGDIDNDFTNLVIRQAGVDALTFSGSQAANFSSSVTATSFSGAATGLTGTASSLTAGAIVSQANSATITASSSATANTLAQRDANGYLRAVYFYDDNTSVGASGITSIYGGAGDKYIYKFSSAAVQSFLGLGSNAYTSTTYAPIASPALTGVPTAPTASTGTNNTQIATTAFVQSELTTKGVKGSGTVLIAGDGTTSVFDLTGLTYGAGVVVTAASADAVGLTYYIRQTLPSYQWVIDFASAPASGTSLRFNYVHY